MTRSALIEAANSYVNLADIQKTIEKQQTVKKINGGKALLQEDYIQSICRSDI